MSPHPRTKLTALCRLLRPHQNQMSVRRSYIPPHLNACFMTSYTPLIINNGYNVLPDLLVQRGHFRCIIQAQSSFVQHPLGTSICIVMISSPFSSQIKSNVCNNNETIRVSVFNFQPERIVHHHIYSQSCYRERASPWQVSAYIAAIARQRWSCTFSLNQNTIFFPCGGTIVGFCFSFIFFFASHDGCRGLSLFFLSICGGWGR